MRKGLPKKEAFLLCYWAGLRNKQKNLLIYGTLNIVIETFWGGILMSNWSESPMYRIG
jgi:hypothetical protein